MRTEGCKLNLSHTGAMFFVSITINGKTTIPIDHLVTALKGLSASGAGIYGLVVIILDIPKRLKIYEGKACQI